MLLLLLPVPNPLLAPATLCLAHSVPAGGLVGTTLADRKTDPPPTALQLPDEQLHRPLRPHRCLRTDQRHDHLQRRLSSMKAQLTAAAAAPPQLKLQLGMGEVGSVPSICINCTSVKTRPSLLFCSAPAATLL